MKQTIRKRAYEGGLKSFQPSLLETRDTQPLGRESDRNWRHCKTMSMIKLFWPCGHWNQHTGKVKSSRPSLKLTLNSGKAAVG